jgi:hypothetical protein
MTTTTTTLKIASNDMIYSIGLFRWIEEAIMPFDDVNAAKLLDGLGIRDDLIEPILKGDYTKSTEGETLIINIFTTTTDENPDSLPTSAAEYRAMEYRDSGYGLGDDDIDIDSDDED